MNKKTANRKKKNLQEELTGKDQKSEGLRGMDQKLKDLRGMDQDQDQDQEDLLDMDEDQDDLRDMVEEQKDLQDMDEDQSAGGIRTMDQKSGEDGGKPAGEDGTVRRKSVRKNRNRTAAGLLALILGSLGIHKFYQGKYVQGTLFLLFFWTGIPGVLATLEGAHLLGSDSDDGAEKGLNPGSDQESDPETDGMFLAEE